MQRCWSSLLRYCSRDFFGWLPIFDDIQPMHPRLNPSNKFLCGFTRNTQPLHHFVRLDNAVRLGFTRSHRRALYLLLRLPRCNGFLLAPAPKRRNKAITLNLDLYVSVFVFSTSFA